MAGGTILLAAHGLCLQGIPLCKKLSNKQSGSVLLELLDIQHYSTTDRKGYQQR